MPAADRLCMLIHSNVTPDLISINPLKPVVTVYTTFFNISSNFTGYSVSVFPFGKLPENLS